MHGRPRYAVFGHPVAHSQSPRIHAAFAAQFGIELDYSRIDAPPDGFAAALEAFARDGGRGANVTLPHKAQAARLCRHLTGRAARAGAVNTLVRIDAGETPVWEGDNTDGIGLVRDLRDRHGLVLDGARVLVLGAGGAAAGIVPALLDAGVARLLVANRGIDRARALVSRLGDARLAPAALDGLSAGASDATDGAAGGFDLVINATSAARGEPGALAGLAGVLRSTPAAIDLGYGAAARPFLALAADCGVPRRVDGLGMLVEQAAESFRRWHRLQPATGPVYLSLRTESD